MFGQEDGCLTDIQDAFISQHGQKKYMYFVHLLRFSETERIRREFSLSYCEVSLWRQLISLQDSYDVFCRRPSIWR